VEWRITFFVESAERTPEGWVVEGEAGLGPPAAGDAFTFVQHQGDQSEDRLVMTITEAEPRRLRLATTGDAVLTRGDILGGEAER
jgi:hypothetical protein